MDIIKPQWLVACEQEGELLHREPRYDSDAFSCLRFDSCRHSCWPRFVVFMCEATRREMATVVDEFGDHYTRDTNPEELKEVFKRVASEAPALCVRPPPAALASLDDDEYLATETSFALFKGYVMYIDDRRPVVYKGVEPGEPATLSMTVTAFQIRLYGGAVSPVLDE